MPESLPESERNPQPRKYRTIMSTNEYDLKTEVIAALGMLRTATAMLAALDVPLDLAKDFVSAAHAEQRAAQLQHWPTDSEPTTGDEAARVFRCLGLSLSASSVTPQFSALSREWSLWAEGLRARGATQA